jgi:outer membrane receptor protein involved in Fe transport
VTLLSICLPLAIAFPAAAQTDGIDDPFAGVEEMIVNGSGTAALLAPASTSAISFDSADLDAYGVDDLGDIAAYVPNLEIRSQNATNASFFVRGVGLQDFGANASSSVPIFQDGVPRNPSATQLVGLFDIGGLSVLKGPQGSGNYRNASAGAFLVEAAKPAPEFSGMAKVSLARIVSVDARDANRYDFEMAMNAPVFEDWISARVSARYSHENPFWENGCANRSLKSDRPTREIGFAAPSVSLCGENVLQGQQSSVSEFLSKYIGEVDDFGFRGQVRIAPPNTPLDFTFRAEISRLNRDSTTGQHIGTTFGGNQIGLGGSDRAGYRDQDIAAREAQLFDAIKLSRPDLSGPRRDPDRPFRILSRRELARELYKNPLDKNPYRGDLDRPGRTILDTHVASMTGVIDLDEIDIKMQAGFVDYKKSEGRDTDLSPNIQFPSRSNDQAWEIYGDLKVSGEAIGDLPLEWATGFYGMHEQVEATNIQSVFDDLRTNIFQQEIYSWGVFAEGRYEFLEAFTLAAGVRYNWERKDFEVDSAVQSLAPPPPGLTENLIRRAGSRNQRTWDAFTGFAEIRFDFTEDVATYIKYSRGFKAGHFNPSRASEARNPDQGFADPEQIDAFEWGLEFAGWAGRVNGLANIFYYNYKNYQVFRLTTEGPTGVFRTIRNADKARNYGAELELNVRPLEGFVPEEIEGLQVRFLAGWLVTNYIEFTNSENRIAAGQGIGVSIDYSGAPLISAPTLQFTTTFTWPLDLHEFGTITPQYDFTWTDDTPFDPNRGRGEVDLFGESRFRPYLVGNRAYTLHNVRLTWEPAGDSGLKIAGWCRNVTDERYKTFSVDISTFNDQSLNYVADPRVCGGEASFSW